MQSATSAVSRSSFTPNGKLRVDGNSGRATSYGPNSRGEWQNQSDFAESPLAITGAADHWNFREDDSDYFGQPGALFRLMGEAERQRLFDNTARSIAAASEEVRDRHISNCRQADLAYGDGVALALANLLT